MRACTLIVVLAAIVPAIPALSAAETSGRAAVSGAGENPIAEALLARARLWEDRNRLDLARETLEKLFRVRHDHADGLALLTVVEIRANRPLIAAGVLTRLRKTAPNHPQVDDLTTWLRVLGADREKLHQARQLALRAQRGREGDQVAAVNAYRTLYPGGPPDGELAFEYWQVLGKDPNHRAASGAALDGLVRRHPDNLRYRFARIERRLDDDPDDMAALGALREFTRLPDYARAAVALWRQTLRRMQFTAASRHFVVEYLALEPGDSAIAEQFKHAAVGARRVPAGEPANTSAEAAAAFAALARGDLAQAGTAFAAALQHSPEDANLLGGMGLTLLRQGRHVAAGGYFQRALERQPENAGKWTSLRDTARFWGLMKEVGDALRNEEWSLAETLIASARQLQPDAAALWLADARLQRALGKIEAAGERYAHAARSDPASATPPLEWIETLVQAGMLAQARQEMNALPRAQWPQAQDEIVRNEVLLLRAEAQQQMARGDLPGAVRLYDAAVSRSPDDPWLRFAMARLLLRTQGADAAIELLRDYSTRKPDDPEGWYALALLHESNDAPEAALDSLEHIADASRSEAMRRLQRRLWVDARLAHAVAGTDRHDAAIRELTDIERAVGDDPALALQVVAAWQDIGEATAAAQLLARIETLREPLSPDLALAYTRSLARAGNAPQTLRMLAQPSVSAQLSPQQVLDIRLQLLEGQLAPLLRQRAWAPARALLDEFLAQYPDQAAALARLAQVAGEQNDFPAQREALERALLLAPQDGVLRVAYMAALYRSGEGGQVLRALAADAGLMARLPARERLDLARLLLDHHEMTLAQQALRIPPPDDARLRMQHSLIESELARRTGDVEAAVGLFVRALDAGRAAGEVPDSWQMFNYARLLDQRSPWLNLGFDRRDRDGTPGISQFDASETVIEFRAPHGRGDEVFVRIESPRIDAGKFERSLPTLFGTLTSRSLLQWADPTLNDAATTPVACPLFCFSMGEQRTAGSGVAVGVQRGDVKLDIGFSPREFAVPNWFGGVQTGGALGQFSWSAELSRRPVTSSLLSWAGVAHDGARAYQSLLTSIPGFFSESLRQVHDAGVSSSGTGASLSAAQQAALREALVAQLPALRAGSATLQQTLSTLAMRTGVPLSDADLAGVGDTAAAADRLLAARDSALWQNQRWGGVSANGVRFGMVGDQGGRFGFWSSLGWYRLIGRNVRANSRTQLMAGGTLRLLNDDDAVFSLGLTGIGMWHQNNSGEFSFGHGGYFSPRTYRSLSLPVAYAARSTRWSFFARASASVSKSTTDGAPAFPEDLDVALAGLPAFNENAYAASRSSRWDRGWAFASGLEVQVTPRLFLGARIEIDRGTDFAPNRSMLYLRYNLERTAAQAVKLFPEPLLPSSQF